MREEKENENSENRARVSRFADQNAKPNSNSSKLRSAFAKGFSAADKKTKALPSKKQPLANSNSTNVVSTNSQQPRVKRSLIGDLACSMTATQVHPQGYNHKRQSSRDLFNELDHLRGLLQESKDREFKLRAELSERKRDSNPKVLELQREIDELVRKVGVLEGEKGSLAQQLAALALVNERNEDGARREARGSSKGGSVEMEVVELRRLNKELQMQKRSLACKLAAVEAQLASLSKASESEIVAKIKAEASQLRTTNEDLSKQVEGLQLNRLNEVEELAYLRWVNSCLRNELRNSCPTTNSEKASSPNSVESCDGSVGPLSCQSKESVDYSSAKRVNLIKKLKKWPITEEDLSNLDCQDDNCDETWIHQEDGRSPRRRHSISGSKCLHEDFLHNSRRQSDGFMSSKDAAELLSPASDLIHTPHFIGSCSEHKLTASVEVEKRALRIPNPPPRPSCSSSNEIKETSSTQIAPPPPPPPPPPPMLSSKGSAGVVQRAPQVVEFYHTLMKRDSRKDTSNGGVCDAPDVANVRSSMIGEIENRSSHLLAIKADVETQGEFVNFLIKEVNNAAYQNIEDVVAFVKWLDDELCYLVDERAVLKHFDWPERKADALREAAFGYRDVKKLEWEVTSYRDDPRLPCDIAMKKMAALSEKMERTVYNIQRTRDSLIRNCREFRIPTDWMLDNGIISKIKLGAVKVAKKYIKRVATELQSKAGQDKDPALYYMLLQGVRFAFRIHQFAGGFDAETMHAFEELRNLGHVLNKT